MKYGFIRLRNDDGTALYMETREFERYNSYDVFRNHAEALVVYDKIYIAVFPLMFNEEEITEYNEDATITDELPVTDIAFRSAKASTIARQLGCVN